MNVTTLPFTEHPVTLSHDTCPHCGQPIASDPATLIRIDGVPQRIVDRAGIGSHKTINLKSDEGWISAHMKAVPVLIVEPKENQ